MYEKDRDFIRQQVAQVLASWGVTISGRGTGVGDIDNWIDYVVNNKGWEPYWIDRIGLECQKSGYTYRGVPPPEPPPSTPPPAPPTRDLYLEKLNAMEAKIDTLLDGLRGYFRAN